MIKYDGGPITFAKRYKVNVSTIPVNNTKRKFARRSLSVRGPLIIWSDVPNELKNISFPKFKKNQKKNLIFIL